MLTRNYLFLFSGLLIALLTGCKQEPAKKSGDLSDLIEQYNARPADTLLQQIVQSIGKEIRDAETGEAKEKWIEQALAVTSAPDKGNLREVFLTESLKNSPGGPGAAGYLWSVAEMAAIRNRMEEASLLFLGFKERFPGDARNEESEKYIQADQRNRTAFLKSLDHDIKVASVDRPDTAAFIRFISLCEAHALGYPATAQAPDYLYKAAAVAQDIGQSGKAAQLYDWISTYYPGHGKAQESLLMKGFLLETVFGQKEDAKRVYEQFLQRYPKDSLADDAAYLLKQLKPVQ